VTNLKRIGCQDLFISNGKKFVSLARVWLYYNCMMKIEIENPLKESFIDRIYGHLDDRLIEVYLKEYLEVFDEGDLWADFEDVLHVVEDFKRYVSFCEACEE
jgi:hypothetical protein